MVVKVASVIGKVFPVDLLQHIFPIKSTHWGVINDNIKDLESKGFFLPYQPGQTELHYTFSNSIFQEVSYDLLLFSQKSELHCCIAEWYEEHYRNDLIPYYRTLSYHLVLSIETDMERQSKHRKLVEKTIQYIQYTITNITRFQYETEQVSRYIYSFYM